MNLLQDLSTITTVPIDIFNKLNIKAVWCISDNFYESIINKDEITSIDIGIGQLLIKLDNEQIKYKFIPSKILDDTLKSTYKDKKSKLQYQLDRSIIKNLTQTYKDIL